MPIPVLSYALFVDFHAELSRVFHREVSHFSLWFSVHAGVKALLVSFFFRATAAELSLKRKLSFPVSRM